MFLKNTGGRGIKQKGLRSLVKNLDTENIFYAGGVRYWNQLNF